MKKLLILSTVACASLIASQQSFAHTEHDKARFVSHNGQDTGNCESALRPCKSIAYAVQKANKGDRVLVATGTYEIKNEDDLFYFKSGFVPIKGGFNRFDHFQSQNPQSNVATLVGIPSSMRAEVESMGFTVAVDGKHGLPSEKLNKKLAKYS